MEFIRRAKRAFDILMGNEEPIPAVESNIPPPSPPENPSFSFTSYGALAEREAALHDYHNTRFPEAGEFYRLSYEHVMLRKIRPTHFDVRGLGDSNAIRERIYFANARGQVFTLYVLGDHRTVMGFAIDMIANDAMLNARPMMFYRIHNLTDVRMVGPSTSGDCVSYIEDIDGVWTPILRLIDGQLILRVLAGGKEVEYCLAYIPDVGGEPDLAESTNTPHGTTEYVVDESESEDTDLTATVEAVTMAAQRTWANEAARHAVDSRVSDVHGFIMDTSAPGLITMDPDVLAMKPASSADVVAAARLALSDDCSEPSGVSVETLQINATKTNLDIEGDMTAATAWYDPAFGTGIPLTRVVDRDQIKAEHVYLSDCFKKANLTFEIVKCNERMVALLTDGAGRTIRYESFKVLSKIDTARWDIRRVRYLDANATIPSKIEVAWAGYLFVFEVEYWDGVDRRAGDIDIALEYLGACKGCPKPSDYSTNWVSSYPPEENLGVIPWDAISRSGEKYLLSIPGTDMTLATIQADGTFKIAIIDRYWQCVYVELGRQPTHMPDYKRITRVRFATKESAYPDLINLQWGDDDITLTLTSDADGEVIESNSRTTEY